MNTTENEVALRFTPRHTPGPWEVDGFNLTSVMRNEGSEIWPQWKHLCDCNYGYSAPEKFFEENKANARLISAAPELLDLAKAAYLILYGGNSVSFEDAVNRSLKNADDFERKMIQIIRKATA